MSKENGKVTEVIPKLTRSSSFTHTHPKALKPFDSGEIKILLLENISKTAVGILTKEGYQVESHSKALSEDALIEKIRDVHAIGIRSKTKLTRKVLQEAKKLLVIGCFCIGTNQVDLEFAARQGIAVFNSPFSNSRSVAELVIAEIVCLSRQLGDRNIEMHQNNWNKVSSNCYEIRGKTLGIVGCGHIGSQLSVLAEAMGMKVYFHDVIQIMPLGTAKQVNTLYELLEYSDFVSLHVPETEETKSMFGEEEFQRMKKGSYLINASRGTVVNIPSLIKALKNGHLSGAAIDVYPREPSSNGPNFNNELSSWTKDLLDCKNLILTPHIGGSTEEAQHMIGVEVANALYKYINYGISIGAVNIPEIDLRAIDITEKNSIRVLFVHHNVPGVLKEINDILSDHNVEKQYSDSRGEIAYLMADISQVDESDIRKIYESISSTKANILTRIVY
ncbi:13477_t:CDS:2 [Entrophospora sp. SA101]|nr:15082_t:CDS:2 [Entrophospora sp. SA101]CAJ0647137.1 13477_t:CDS:2 [Entrophospora sp. SA101]CAJ0825179.1 11085_t:CDS:2 [Entrophospora sp. SA101]CAJ0881654.1 9914_t:CDS:2 [Entrophospora sp. SA101]